MRRRGLTDGQWEIIEPLMPPPKPTGRPRSDLRVVVEGVLWIVRAGAPFEKFALNHLAIIKVAIMQRHLKIPSSDRA